MQTQERFLFEANLDRRAHGDAKTIARRTRKRHTQRARRVHSLPRPHPGGWTAAGQQRVLLLCPRQVTQGQRVRSPQTSKLALTFPHLNKNAADVAQGG